jgi:hypothetical protein
MLRKLLVATLVLMGGAFAHVKPFAHEHIGFLHTEDILLVGAVAALVLGVLFVAVKRAVRERA